MHAVILGCEGTRLTQEEHRFFAAINPVGFILFARNVESGDQLRALTSALRQAVGRDAPIFIDQEGGRVQRIRPPIVSTDWDPPLDFVARHGAHAVDALRLRYRIIAAELLSLGIDGNCVPAVDLPRATTHPILRNRLLADTPEAVSRLGRVVADAHLDVGVLPVIKHMPGHGRGTMDSHLDLPVTDAARTDLEVDFRPFTELSDLPLGMTAHMVFSDLDDRPATQSPVLIDLIRQEIGFGGLLMTDDISMQALRGTVAERGRVALDAGCDVVLHCNGDLEEMRALCDATGPLTEAAQARADRAIAARRPAEPVDIAQCAADLEALSA